jgi:hypothetical protein
VAIATDLHEQGIPTEEIQTLLGHSDVRTTNLYNTMVAVRHIVEASSMTTRDSLGIHVRRARIIFAVGVAVIAATLVTVVVILASTRGNGRPPEWIGYIFMGGMTMGACTAAAAGLYACSTMLCPWCGGNLGAFVYQRWFRNSQVRFCLHCGKSLDDKVPAGGKPGKSPSKGKRWEDELA